MENTKDNLTAWVQLRLTSTDKTRLQEEADAKEIKLSKHIRNLLNIK